MEEIYINFKVICKEDPRLYLDGSWDATDLLEDEYATGEWEYMQNDGTHSEHFPTYWEVNGEDLSFEFHEFVSTIDFDVVEQDLWGLQNENRTLDYNEYILIINDGDDTGDLNG